MNATLTNTSIDLQGRSVTLTIHSDIGGNNVVLECGSSVDEIIIKQSENPNMSLFEALTIIASEKLSITVTVPTDLSGYLVNL